jgi:hypothetical protein
LLPPSWRASCDRLSAAPGRSTSWLARNKSDSCCGAVAFRSSWGAIAVPAVVGFNLGARNPLNGRMQGFRVDLSGALGLEPGSGALGWTASVALGYATM